MKYSIAYILLLITIQLSSQETPLVLQPDRVFDGTIMHEGWIVIVENEAITEIGSSDDIDIPAGAAIKILKGQTLMPGMIEGHSHLLLHPYNETSWNDQVLKESLAERAIRAGVYAETSLMAGITTMRDLGSEGAGYTDVGVKQAIQKGVIPGPDLIVAGPAIVATGSYGPKGFADHVVVPLGAHEADGVDHIITEVRRQIGGGADFIKVYADYRWGPNGEAMPTFSVEELKLIVDIAASSGRKVAAHAATAEAMRRATLAGVYTIEHGDAGTREVFKLMKERGVALCPTLAAGDAISQYRGWKKGIDPEPERIKNKRASFTLALESGVSIVAGGDVGVYPHGDNVREFEMMVDYGMQPMDVLRAITSDNARLLEIPLVGQIAKGYKANLIAINGDPSNDVSRLRDVPFVMKGGIIYTTTPHDSS